MALLFAAVRTPMTVFVAHRKACLAEKLPTAADLLGLLNYKCTNEADQI